MRRLGELASPSRSWVRGNLYITLISHDPLTLISCDPLTLTLSPKGERE